MGKRGGTRRSTRAEHRQGIARFLRPEDPEGSRRTKMALEPGEREGREEQREEREEQREGREEQRSAAQPVTVPPEEEERGRAEEEAGILPRQQVRSCHKPAECGGEDLAAHTKMAAARDWGRGVPLETEEPRDGPPREVRRGAGGCSPGGTGARVDWEGPDYSPGMWRGAAAGPSGHAATTLSPPHSLTDSSHERSFCPQARVDGGEGELRSTTQSPGAAGPYPPAGGRVAGTPGPLLRQPSPSPARRKWGRDTTDIIHGQEPEACHVRVERGGVQRGESPFSPVMGVQRMSSPDGQFTFPALLQPREEGYIESSWSSKERSPQSSRGTPSPLFNEDPRSNDSLPSEAARQRIHTPSYGPCPTADPGS